MQHRAISGASARSVDGGVSSNRVDSSIQPIASHRPATALPARSENYRLLAALTALTPLLPCPLIPPAPSRRRAIAPPASAADAAASCRGRAARDAAPRPSLAREHVPRHCPLPTPRETVGIVAAAEEARAVPGRERGRLVEKEQLGPAARRHHLAPPAPEFADAGDPRRARPALFQQRLGAGSWMMPRLPVNRPRCGVAMMSPVGVTRFCSGMRYSDSFPRDAAPLPACGERVG